MQEYLLSIEQVNFVGINIQQLYKSELSRLILKNPEHGSRVQQFVLTLYMEQISTFFTLSVVQHRAEVINTDSIVRDFVLDLSEKFSFLLTNSELETGDKLLVTIVESIKKNHGKKTEYNLLHPSLVDSIAVEESVLVDLLKNNFWLLTLYLLILYFSPLDNFAPPKGANKSNR